MHIHSGLRTKLLVLIVPMTILVILAMAFVSHLGTRAAITRLATRHLSYKAEQLRDFAWSEWEVLTELEIESSPEFLQASKDSIQSYTNFLLRSSTELIFAVNKQGEIVMSSGTLRVDTQEDLMHIEEGFDSGWIQGRILGEDRIGIVFDFPPYDWTIVLTDLQSSFFQEATTLRQIYTVFLALAFITITVLTYYYVGYNIRPIEQLTKTIITIRQTGDLSYEVRSTLNDETGRLAEEFNHMLADLRKTIGSLEEASRAEHITRLQIMQQEEETLTILGKAVEFRDQETGDHQMRIGELCALFARLLDMDKDAVKLFHYSAPLHDIGKIAIPDSILHKPGRLSPEEYELIKQHTTLGWRLLKNGSSRYLIEGAVIALNHHEKWDGNGYPRGLSGTDIPLSGRIVGIIDVLDALISKRPYKAAWAPEKALEFIASQSGRHFDPHLTSIFTDNFPKFLEIIMKYRQAIG